MQEFYATTTRKLRPAMTAVEAQRIVRGLAVWRPVPIDLPVLERAWSWWGALIVSATQGCECRVLLTEDLQHGQEFDMVRVIDPFASADRTPRQILDALP